MQEAPTAEFASLVYGDGVTLDDPAEAFHEASRLYPHVAPGRLAALVTLAESLELQQTVARSSRLHPHRPGVELPPRRLPRARFGRLLSLRRSALAELRRPLRLGDISAVLAASYASSGRGPGELRRPVPSGGALYPLELYLISLDVDGLAPAVWHYDPFAHRLALLSAVDPAELRSAVVEPTLVDRASALLAVTAMFWRSRFKYGLRGYRFAVLEAGHVVQNAVLAATALRLPALPLGGFYDRLLDAVLQVDGLDEAVVHALLLGGHA